MASTRNQFPLARDLPPRAIPPALHLTKQIRQIRCGTGYAKNARMALYNSTSESFLNYCRDERRMSKHTVRAYRLDLDRFGEFLTAHHPSVTLADISKEHLRAY